MSEYEQKILWGSFITFAGIIIAAALAYLLRIILARNLTVEEVGLYAAVLNFIIFASLFQRLGTEAALVRYINVWKVQQHFARIKQIIVEIVWFQIVMGIVFMIAIYLSADYLALHYFSHSMAKPILLAFSTLLILLIFEDIPRRIFQSVHKMFWFSFVEAFKATVLILCTTIGFLYSKSVWVPVLSFLLSTISAGIIGSIVSVVSLPFLRQHYQREPGVFKEVFIFGMPLLFLVIGNKVIDSLDILMLTYFRTLTEVGIYSVVLPTAGLCLLLFRPISIVLLSLGTELWEKKETEMLTHILSKTYKYMTLVMLPVIVAMLVYAEQILGILFGSAYLAGANALRIIIVGVFFYGLANININMFTASGYPKISGRIMLYGALCNFIANLILIPFFGMIGAAIATATCYFITYYLSVKDLGRKTNIKVTIERSFLIKIGCTAAGLTVTLFLLKQYLIFPIPILGMIINIALAGLFYIILINWLRIFTFNECKQLLMLLLQKK